MRDSAAWRRFAALFDEGEYWEAHEALEPAWLEARDAERRFMGGVILLAAALHKARAMGSPRGGRRNYAKALRHLATVPDRYGGIEVRELEARVHAALRDPRARPRVPRVREPRDEHDGAGRAESAAGSAPGRAASASDAAGRRDRS